MKKVLDDCPPPLSVLKNNLPSLMKIARCPKVRAAINGSSSRYFYHFVLDNCAASLYAEYIMSEASPGDDPMARHNFVCLKTSAFAPYCVKPIRNSGSRALASLPIICTPWHLDVIHVRRSHPTHLCMYSITRSYNLQSTLHRLFLTHSRFQKLHLLFDFFQRLTILFILWFSPGLGDAPRYLTAKRRLRICP